ncbi:MAG: hypothetical protein MI923_17035, partial [Phycisphaerales bacterium]|nr:hypothetical protein [Phycisphaerales bacterium]
KFLPWHVTDFVSKLLLTLSKISLSKSEQTFVLNNQPISRTSAHKCKGVHVDGKPTGTVMTI